ncbi:hypothetical protein HanIR_Chr12g0607161 [Helianthus annuus]|nr:hypothetical protein HanIR_Chr12g0607161 [Helianthus annuus]
MWEYHWIIGDLLPNRSEDPQEPHHLDTPLSSLLSLSVATHRAGAATAGFSDCHHHHCHAARVSHIVGNTGSRNDPDLQYRSSVSPLAGKEKMPRVSSSPLLKIDGSAMGIVDNKNVINTHMGRVVRGVIIKPIRMKNPLFWSRWKQG